MSAEERRVALRRFREERGVRVLLLSLKAGGVGLNLTAATRVYLLDPWWNPAVEEQAIPSPSPHQVEELSETGTEFRELWHFDLDTQVRVRVRVRDRVRVRVGN